MVFLITKLGETVDRFLALFLSEKTRSYLLGVDRFQRYIPIINKIEENETVLDVGGGGGEIIKFLGRNNITVLDPVINDLKGFNSKKICGDGCKIPLKDSSFDTVLSIASLEHIPPNKREDYVTEHSE